MWSEFGARMGGGCDWRRHKSWWGGEGFEDFWGGPRGRPHRRQGRVFEQGDLKLVILRLLAEKPRHGYDVIKELEARFGGRYAPSPGTVYPTLTMLEDMGFARVVPEEGGKRSMRSPMRAARISKRTPPASTTSSNALPASWKASPTRRCGI